MKKKEFTYFTQHTHKGKSSTQFWKLILALPLFLLGAINVSQAQCALVCNDDVNVSLPGTNENCEVMITPDMVLEDPTSCSTPLIVIIQDSQGNTIPNSPVVDETYIGQTLIYSVQENVPGGNSCWGTMDIEDKLGPNIANCDDYEIYCLFGTTPTLEGGNAPSPNFSDCSGFVQYSFVDQVQDGTCDPTNNTSTSYTEIITRTWTAVDAYGNISNCTQEITVLRVSLADFTPMCPTTVDFACTATGFPDTSPAATGYPTIDLGTAGIVDIIPGANNSCSIASSFQDETLSTCGGGQKILRTWTVYDWCLPTQPGFNPITCIQQIQISDDLAPTITCPTSILATSVSSSCAATVQLPAANVMDECSPFSVRINTPYGQITGNGGILPNVAVGTYTLTYIAKDECENSSSCEVELNVVDNTPPVVICDEFTTVSLADSTAIVAAEIFDDGTQDNCALDYFEIRRMPTDCVPDGTLFGPFVEFDCCDIDENVMVALRAFDIYGNSNICMIEVEVQDKLDPEILCPADKIIECGDPIPSIQEPIIIDNCGATYTVDEDDGLTNCGVGVVTRTYTATDQGGRTGTCIQTVTVENNDPFTLADIQWPDDFESFECDANLEPNNLEAPFDYPITNESTCDLIAVTFTDQILPTNMPACGKILRLWVIIDWCQYNPNVFNSPGYWEHTQILRITDVEAPEITCPSSITINSYDPDCASDYVSVPMVTATDCSNSFNFFYTVDLYSDGTVDANGVSADVSNDYPFGTHKVEYSVEDLCGNSTPCEFEITVQDAKLPTPVCLNGLAVELMPDPDGNGGMIQLNPELFDSGSYDNCEDNEDLTLTLAPNFFTCDDVGTKIVTLTVTDASGNSDFCETYVIIQDNMNICPETLTATVGGMIANEDGDGVDEVMVNVSGNGPATQPVMSNGGNYQFSALDMYHDYTFTPENNENPSNGVTTLDLVHMTKHILNIQPLDSPYKIIAGDVNNSGSISTLDVVLVRKLILQINTDFPNNTSWRFVDAAHEFENPMNPFSQPFPEYFNINNLDADDMGVDFIGIKIGDVNGSANPNYLLGADDRSFDGELNFDIQDRGLKAGETYRVDFKTNDFLNIFGYQFTLDFDETALELIDIIPGELDNLTTENFGLAMLDEGIITSSWDNSKNTLHNNGTTLFSFTFLASTNTTLSDLIKITSEYTPAEAYQADLNAGTQTLAVDLNFTEGQGMSSHDKFMVYQNKPNPFKDETAIAWEMPEAGWSRLTITDFSGKVLKVIADDYPIGYNEVKLTKAELGSSQIMFFKLETACATETRKMVMID
jgi:hypothetical protein